MNFKNASKAKKRAIDLLERLMLPAADSRRFAKMSDSLKVVQILPQLNAGGVERGTLEINEALVAAGHKSLVISGGGRLVQELISAGGQHVEMAVWKKSPLTLLTVRKMRSWIQQNQPDILHVRSRVPAWVTWLAWKKLPATSRPKLVTTVHGLNRPNAYSKIMTCGETVIAVSQTCRKYLRQHYPSLDESRIRVIYRGVSSEQFPYGWQADDDWKTDWYNQFPQLRDQFVVCISGRITRLKGHLDLLKAVRTLADDHRRIMIVIAGAEDPRREKYSQELRQQIADWNLQDQVVFTGHRSDIRNIMSVSNVIVSATYKPPESFGRAVLESVRLGKITFGYDHGGVGEILDQVYPEGKIPLRDTAALAEKIAAAMDGKIAIPEDRQAFPLKDMQLQTVSLYEELCSTTKS